MKAILMSLSVLFLCSCGPNSAVNIQEAKNISQIESVKATARTALQEARIFFAEAEAIKTGLAQSNTYNFSEKLEIEGKIHSLAAVLQTQMETAEQAYKAVRAALSQAELATNPKEVKAAGQQAISNRDRVISARNKVKETLDQIKAIIDS